MLKEMGELFLPYCTLAPILDESVGERKILYRLGESEVFNFANKNSSSGSNATLVDTIPKMVVTGQGFLRVGLDQLDKTVRYELFESARFPKLTCRKAMIQLLEYGSVVMVYSEDYRVPASIPYIASVVGSKSTIFVNVSDFLELNDLGVYTVTATRNYHALMAILMAACAAYRIMTISTQLPADLADGMVLMYANMMERAINSLVHMDPVMRDKIRYLATEFALIQMYGTEMGVDMFYRYKTKFFPKLSKMITDSIDNQFKVDNFDKLSFFIDGLKEIYPSMRGLTLYNVYDKWIRSYGAATAMSIDYLGYHLYTICMVLMESPLVSRMALEPVLERSKGADMYKRLQTLIGQ